MRGLILITLVLLLGCASAERIERCEKRISVLEERQKLIESKIDEALSKWDLVEEAVKSLKAYRKEAFVISKDSPMLDLYVRAYSLWLRKNFKKASWLFRKFVNTYDDEFLTPQAYLLLADCYERLGLRKRSCLVLDEFLNRFKKENLFYNAGISERKRLRCGR